MNFAVPTLFMLNQKRANTTAHTHKNQRKTRERRRKKLNETKLTVMFYTLNQINSRSNCCCSFLVVCLFCFVCCCSRFVSCKKKREKFEFQIFNKRFRFVWFHRKIFFYLFVVVATCSVRGMPSPISFIRSN